MTRKNAICIIGMGYVGSTLAVGFSQKGVRVYGVEKRADVMDKLNAGIAPFYENGFDSALADSVAQGLLTCHQAVPENGQIDTYIITVGTPIMGDNKVDESYLLSAVDAVKKSLKPNDCVILRSTLKLGVTRSVVKNALDTLGIPYRLAFCPERTVEGKALEELETMPQIIGGIDKPSNEHAQSLFAVMTKKCITVDTPEAAELCKLICNTQRDLYFGFANEVASLCDHMGIPVSQVIDVIGDDYPRVNMPKPGLVGGPCLTKDAHILVQGAREMGYTPEIALQGRTTNEKVIDESMGLLKNTTQHIMQKIAILGLAFKGQPATGDMRGSTVYPLVESLKKHWPDADYFGFDALATDTDVATLNIARVNDIASAFQDADLIILHNNHQDLQTLDLAKLGSTMSKNGVIYDFWNMYDIKSIPKGLAYCGLGHMCALDKE